MIQERFELDILVFVILQKELNDLLSKAPAWWGTDDKKIYNNLIFVKPSFDAEIIAEKIGEATKELEQYVSVIMLFSGLLIERSMRKQTGGKNCECRNWRNNYN